MYSTSIVPLMLVSAADSKAFFDQVFQDGLPVIPDPAMTLRPSANLIFLKDSEGMIKAGGLVQFTFDVAALDVFWVSEKLRRQGYGTQLYREIEQLAIRKGMRRAIVSTFEFQNAIGFWVQLGFEKFAELDDYPPGSHLLYLQKKFPKVTAHAQ